MCVVKKHTVLYNVIQFNPSLIFEGKVRRLEYSKELHWELHSVTLQEPYSQHLIFMYVRGRLFQPSIMFTSNAVMQKPTCIYVG